jgi:hypothetical protein
MSYRLNIAPAMPNNVVVREGGLPERGGWIEL